MLTESQCFKLMPVCSTKKLKWISDNNNYRLLCPIEDDVHRSYDGLRYGFITDAWKSLRTIHKLQFHLPQKPHSHQKSVLLT